MRATLYFTEETVRQQLCTLVLKDAGAHVQRVVFGDRSEMLDYVARLGSKVKDIVYGGKSCPDVQAA